MVGEGGRELLVGGKGGLRVVRRRMLVVVELSVKVTVYVWPRMHRRKRKIVTVRLESRKAGLEVEMVIGIPQSGSVLVEVRLVLTRVPKVPQAHRRDCHFVAFVLKLPLCRQHAQTLSNLAASLP